MSQSATFYPIDSNDFSAIQRDQNNFELLKGKGNYVTFQGTHEGLRFVLSKGRNNQETGLVNEIFYPTAYIGNVSQYIFPDGAEEHEFVELSKDKNYEDFEREPVSYHPPEKVKQVDALLNSINDEQFLSQFDPNELNRHNIYPCCWNSNKDDDQVYNEKHLLEDFQNLKTLFGSASATNSYLLCFVG